MDPSPSNAPQPRARASARSVSRSSRLAPAQSRRLRIGAAVLIMGCVVGASSGVSAQAVAPANDRATPPTATSGGATTSDVAGIAAPDSPQTSMTRFLALARGGHFEQAAEYLDLPRRTPAAAADAAEKLLLVLDRRLWIDVERLSPNSTGDLDDALPRGVDSVGSIATADAPTGEPVRIARAVVNGQTRWRFTRATCARIDVWYDALDGQLIRRFVPRRLLHGGAFHVAPWQWIGLGAAAIASLLAGLLVGRLMLAILARIARRTRAEWDDALVPAMLGPVQTGWALVAFHFAVPFFGLVRPAEDGIERAEKLIAGLVFLLASIRAVRVLSTSMSRSEWGRTNPSSRSLVALSARAAQMAAFLLAVLAMLSTFGYDVTGVLAGLGIGGIALAFAAQKTLENLLGAFSIGIDQPLREGDLVNIEGVIGTVEGVGLRSTRVRTLDRHIVSFPNGKLADTAINSMSARDRMRINGTLSIQYGTGSATLRALRDRLEAAALAHDFVLKEDLVIRFVGFGAASLDFELLIWLDARDYASFTEKRELVMFALMEVVESMGLSFATPVRSVQWAPGSPERSAADAASAASAT